MEIFTDGVNFEFNEIADAVAANTKIWKKR